MRSRPLVVAAALVLSWVPALAQQCVGVPKGTKGFFTAGLAGADGASGTGLSFAYGSPRASVLVDQSEVGVFAHANAQAITTIRGSWAINKIRGCPNASFQGAGGMHLRAHSPYPRRAAR